jgi:predicted Zn-dependent protease
MQSVGQGEQIDEYLLSHPVSRKRINAIKAKLKKTNPSKNKKINHDLQSKMDIVLAKLEGFLENQDELLRKYQNSSDAKAIYIKAVAFYRNGETKKANDLLDSLIKKNPSDGFLLELRGQILFEGSHVEDSIISYNQSIKLLSAQDSALAKINFAAAILALKTNDKKLVELAIAKLQEAKNFENEAPILFKYLGNAYAKINDEGRSMLALAEFNLLIDEKNNCSKLAKKAKEKLEENLAIIKEEGGDVSALQADILYAEDLIEEAKIKNSALNSNYTKLNFY